MSEEKKLEAYLNLYIGTPEDSVEDFIYLDMVIPKHELPLWCSPESVGDCSGDDFLQYLEKAFNEARLWTKYTGLRLVVEREGILEFLSEIDETVGKNVKQLLKEA